MANQFMLLFTIICTISVVHCNCKPQDQEPKKKVVHVAIGGHCGASAAPTGPGGSWQIIDSGTVKVCPAGTSCRTGACNCDDLPDGTVTSHSWDPIKEERTCKRVGGQKCDETSQCVEGATCINAICTCDKTNLDIICREKKQDIIIQN